jgi:hypothetical protein
MCDNDFSNYVKEEELWETAGIHVDEMLLIHFSRFFPPFSPRNPTTREKILSLWNITAVLSVENSHHLSTGNCGEIFEKSLFHKPVEGFSTVSQGFAGLKKRNPSRILGIFGVLHKRSRTSLCKTYFFHTLFHNLWKSRLFSRNRAGNQWKTHGRTGLFPQGNAVSFP